MSRVNLFVQLFHPHHSNNHRPKLLHAPMLLLFVVAVVALGSFVHFAPLLSDRLGEILGYASDITVDQVVSQVNQQRASAGLAVMSTNPLLMQAAQAKANDMFANQYWSHTSPSGAEPWSFIKSAGYSYRVAGENLARDFAVTDQAVTAWMQSPTHRANILNNRYTETGVAVVNGTLNGVETTLVVQLFGSPQLAPPQLASAPTPAVSINPTFEPTETTLELASPPNSEVLATVSVPSAQLTSTFRISPIAVLKAISLSLISILIATLIYDLYAIGTHHSLRLVGKNLAHILLLGSVAFMIVLYKSGTIG